MNSADPPLSEWGGPLVRSRGLYYGWWLVLGLGVTETVSYGILSYAFPVFIAPMGGELGWSKTAITGAFSLASLVSGLAAIPAGRWVDHRGARGLMTSGSMLAVAVLLGWSQVSSLATFYLLSVGLGLAMATTLYEPAFAVIANWFVRLRGRALTVLTFMGGFASVIFVPLTATLVEAYGWRAALIWLAVLLAAITLPVHALLLRRRPEDHGLQPDGSGGTPASTGAIRLEPSVSAREAVRSASFRWISAAFGLSSLVTTGIAVHLIPLLLERGYSATFSGAAMGMIGLMALPGRLVFTPLGSRWRRALVTAGIFGLSTLGIAVLLAIQTTAGVWAFVICFGAGFGAITPARAALLAEYYGRQSYGSISGVLALVMALSRAAAPVGLSLLWTVGGGYAPVLWALLGISALAGVSVLLASGAHAGKDALAAEVHT